MADPWGVTLVGEPDPYEVKSIEGQGFEVASVEKPLMTKLAEKATSIVKKVPIPPIPTSFQEVQDLYGPKAITAPLTSRGPAALEEAGWNVAKVGDIENSARRVEESKTIPAAVKPALENTLGVLGGIQENIGTLTPSSMVKNLGQGFLLTTGIDAAAGALASKFPVLNKPVGELISEQKLMPRAKALFDFVSKVKQPQLDSIAGDIANSVDAEYVGTPKSPESIVAKVIRKNVDGNPDYNLLSPKDHARGSIILKNWADAPSVINDLKAKGFNLEVTVDEPLNIFGYRGINSTAKLGEGINGEIQIHTPESWALKQTSDELYRTWRPYNEKQLLEEPGKYADWRNDIAKSRQMWRDYWGKIPLEIKSAISESGRGLDSVADPNVTPLAGAQEPLVNTNGPSSLSQSSLPSESLETNGVLSIPESPSNPIIPPDPGNVNPNVQQSIFTEPQLKLEATKGITEQAKQFFSDKPEGFKEPNEAVRVNQRISNLIKTKQIPVESIPVMKEWGFTNADADTVADLLTQQATFSGRALNFLSQVRKAIPETAIQDIPKVPVTAWEKITARVAAAAESANDITRGMVNLWRASLVSQFKTAVRNQIVTGFRFPIKILDDAAVGAVEAITGQKPAAQAFGPALENIYAVWRSMTPTGRGRLQAILADEPIAAKRLYGSPVSDVTLGDKYSKFLSTFNQAQEFFNRNLVFDATLSGELARAGVKALSQVPDGTQTQFLKKAIDNALDLTMAKSPEGKYSQALVKFFNDFPIMQVIGYPFPRFLTNVVRAQFEFSPFGAVRLLSPKYAEILSSSDKRAAIQVASRAGIGATIMGAAIYIRNSKYAGDKWYEVRPQPESNPGRTIDLRPFNPLLPTYMFLAEAFKDPSRMDNRDWVEGFLGVNRIAGTTLYMTSLLGGQGPDNFKKAVVQLGGEFLGGFSTPLRTYKDLIAHFSKEEGIPRETKISPVTAPFMQNVPILSQKLPPRYSPTRPEPHVQEAPAFEQLSGIRPTTKNSIEQEIDQAGLKSVDYMPKTGIPEADNEIRKIMGQVIDKQISPLINSDFYKNVTTPVKREILKAEIGKLRADVTAVLFGNSLDLTVRRAENRLPKDIVELIKKKRFDILGQFPESLQKNIDKVLLQPSSTE